MKISPFMKTQYRFLSEIVSSASTLVAAFMLLAASPAESAVDFTTTGVSVKSYGAVGNGSTDDTTAITNAINWCKSNGYRTLFFPKGTYKITGALPALNNSFDVVSVVGESANNTIIYTTAPSGTPVFKTLGGSGGLSNAEIRDIFFNGTGTQVGVEIKGTGGVKIRNCEFNNLSMGIIFSNDVSAGTFTEYSVAENCVFFDECASAVKFIKGAGDASFHGSGLKGCAISNGASHNVPAIIVGNAGEQIALYNSPLDFQIWTKNPISIISVPSASSRVFTYGTITVENFAGTAPAVCSGPGNVYQAGSLLSWGNCDMGTLRLQNTLNIMPNGTIVEDRKPYSVTKTINTATTTLTGVSGVSTGSLVSITISGPFYDYRYLLLVTHEAYGGNGVVNTLANPRMFNQAGWGAPTFSADTNGTLIVSNSLYAGKSLTATCVVTPFSAK